MAKMHISVHTNLTEEVGQVIGTASSKAEHTLALIVAKDTEQYVPAKTKTFVNRTRVEGGAIIYPGPYARFLYYGKLMIDPETKSAWAQKGATKVVTGKDLKYRKDPHEKAQSHWFEASKAQNMDRWLKDADKAVKKELGK